MKRIYKGNYQHTYMKNTITLDSIQVKLDYDDSPDISWLEDRVKNPEKFYEGNQKYINKYLPKDKKLLQDFYDEQWFMFGYTIEYTFVDEKGFTKESIDSLWGLDSKSTDYWFKEITRLIKLMIVRSKLQGIKVRPIDKLINIQDNLNIGYEYNNRVHIINNDVKVFCKNNNLSFIDYLNRYDVLSEIEVEN